jgi:hypothetical protein
MFGALTQGAFRISLVNHGPPTIADEVERYLLTGSSDPVYAAWPGNIMERATCGHDELRERDVVLAMLEKSVVFLTFENVETVLLEESYTHSAWTLANLYLAGSGAEMLTPLESNCGSKKSSTIWSSRGPYS